MDGRRTALVALAATLVAAGGARPAASAETAEAPPTACPWTTRFLISPGVTISPQDFTFSQQGTIGPCSGGTGRSGKFTVAKGTGHGSCFTASASAPFLVEWDGGGTSKGVAEAVTATASAWVTGTIAEGLFAGTPFTSLVVLNASGPLNCGTAGVTAAETYGEVVFGPG
jgi:hypothetical protein